MTGVDRLISHQQATGQEPACWGVDPEVFFGPADSLASRPPHVWERRALAVCADCPVVRVCLAEALEFPAAEQYGVVGGMTAGQRRAALWASRRRRGRVQRPRRGVDRRRGSRTALLAARHPAGLADRERWPGALTYPNIG